MNLSIRQVGISTVRDWEVLILSSLQWRNVCTKLHENAPNYSSVIKCAQTGIKGDDVTSMKCDGFILPYGQHKRP
jgi:hypothetical protein